MDFIDKAVEEYAATCTTAMPDLLEELTAATYANLHAPNMLTGRLEGGLLKMLVHLTSAVNVLEVGLFSGYSALSMAQALPAEGKIISLEKDQKVYEFAKSFIAQSPYGHKIEVHVGPALTTLETLALPPLDMVFLDADKRNNINYFEFLLPKVRANGLIVIDNTLWSGRVLQAEDKETIAIDALNKQLAADPRVDVVLLPVRDGVTLVRKK